MATEIEQIERDMPDGSVQKGQAVRDNDKYPDNSQAFLDAVNGQLVEVKDAAGNVIQAALTAGNLEDEVFYGQNVSDAPSSNPSVMDVVFTYLGNGRWSAKVNSTATPGAGRSLRICYNSMGYKSVAEIEARTYLTMTHLFQGYHMTGNGDDGQRSDQILNAHQIIHVI
jgi:hypothetical protein